MKNIILYLICILTYLIGTTIIQANTNTYPLPSGNNRLIGTNIIHVVTKNDISLETIANKYKVGLLAMLEANHIVDPWLLNIGSILTIPTQMLLPDTNHQDIVINLAELRLYLYHKKMKTVSIYPIGIGQIGSNTPTMITSITQKIRNPTWTPTTNIRKKYLEQKNIILPRIMLSGPNNPMGLFALRLSTGYETYLIHGTNTNFGIGMRVTSGCIRLRQEDIKELFNYVKIGTNVHIINEPIKISLESNGHHYIEVHQPLSTTNQDNPQTLFIPLSTKIKNFIASPNVNQLLVNKVISRRSGIPELIDKLN